MLWDNEGFCSYRLTNEMDRLIRLWLSDQCPNSWHNTASTSSDSQPLSAFFFVVDWSVFVWSLLSSVVVWWLVEIFSVDSSVTFSLSF